MIFELALSPLADPGAVLQYGPCGFQARRAEKR